MMYHSRSQRLREQRLLGLGVEPEAVDASFPPSFYSLDPSSAFGASAGCAENHLSFTSNLYPSPPPSHSRPLPGYPLPSSPSQQPVPTFLYDPDLDSFGSNSAGEYSAASNYQLYSAIPQLNVMEASSGSDYEDHSSTLDHRRGSSNGSSMATTVYGGQPSVQDQDYDMLYVDDSPARIGQGQHECGLCSYATASEEDLELHLRAHAGLNLFECMLGGCGAAFEGAVDFLQHTRSCHPSLPPSGGAKRGRAGVEQEAERVYDGRQQQGREATVGDEEDWRYHQQHKRYRSSTAAPLPSTAPVTPPSAYALPQRAHTDPAPRYHHHPQHSHVAPVVRSMSVSVARTLSYGAPPSAPAERTLPRSLSYDGVVPATRYPIARPASPTQPVVLKKFTLPASPAMSSHSSSCSPRMELESAARFEPFVRSGGWEDTYSIPSTPGTSYRRGSGEEGSTWALQQQQQLYSPISPPHDLYPAPPPQQVGDFYPPPSTPATSTVPLARFPPASASSTLPLPEEPLLLPIVPARQSTTTTTASRRKIAPPNLAGSLTSSIGTGGEPALPTLPGRRPSLAPRPVVQQTCSVQMAPPIGATVVLPPSNTKGRPTSNSLASSSYTTLDLAPSTGAGPIEGIHPRFNGTPAPVTKETEKVHSCQFRGCGKMFRRLEHLKRHERSHTQERPYGCEVCGKWFSRSDNLAQHKKTHVKGLGSSPPPQGQASVAVPSV